MNNSEMEFLSRFGWDDYFNSQIAGYVSEELRPAKVINEERGLYRVLLSTDRELWATLKGSMQFNADSRQDYPAVGDWVMVERPSQSERAVIHRVLSRKTLIGRRQVGSSFDVQILATNVDTMFVATSMNSDLNEARIKRYMAIALESGAKPVILLTKSDLFAGDIEIARESLQLQFPLAEIYSLSMDDFEAADFLKKYLGPGMTCVVVGSSGVGKSTLVNYLIGQDRMLTQGIREFDGKGRHTTTSRSLHISRFGGLIIDTPGMRELQLLDHAEGLGSQFSEVEKLLGHCKFSDCKHRTEPGCVITQALDEGELSQDRWESYQKLLAEIKFGLRRQEKRRPKEKRKVEKRQDWKRKYKFNEP